MNETWRDRAACKGMPTDLFFPKKGENREQVAAKAICATCPVRQECYDYAIEVAQQVELIGTWGGTSQKQRIAILHSSGRVASRNRWLYEAS